MGSLRKEKSNRKYLKLLKTPAFGLECSLCDKTKNQTHKQFKYWRIINNAFPYDRIAETHHMIITNRHASESELNTQEEQELKKIKQAYIKDKYDYIMETAKRKTIPGHFHLHLILLKKRIY